MTSNLRIAFPDIPASTVLAAPTASTGYAATNVISGSRRDYYQRSTAGTTSIWEWDYGTTIQPDTLILARVKKLVADDSAAVAWEIKGSAANDFSSPDANSGTIASTDLVGSTADDYLVLDYRLENRLKNSEAVNATGWSGANVTRAANLITETTATGQHYAVATPSPANSVISGVSYSAMVEVKAGAGRIWIKFASALRGGTEGAFFKLDDGTIGTVDNGVSASIEDMGSGVYRCKITATAVSTGTNAIYIFLSPDGSSISYTGDTGCTLNIYKGQFRRTASLATYVQTTTLGKSAFPFALAYQYWRATITTTASFQHEIGKVYLCRSLDFAHDPIKGRKISRTTNATWRGAPHAFTLDWKGVTNANAQAFQTNIGQHIDTRPIFLFSDTYHYVINDKRCMHCRVKDYTITPESHNNNSLRLELEELI